MRLLDFFPAPNYLRLPAVGFDISDQSLKYVKLRADKKDVRLAAFGKKSFSAGIIETGQIKKPDEFTKFLGDFHKELKNDYLIVALPEEKAFIGNIRLPLMKEEEVRGSLELQLEERIPLQAKEAVFDYEITQDAGQGEKESNLNVSFAAVPRALVESYRDALKGAGFTPLAFETEPHALVRALVRPEEKSMQMILDFGKTRTSFVIINGRKIEMSSTIKVAGESLDSAFSKAFSVTLEEGERLKREKGLCPPLLPVVSEIKNEAERVLAYRKSHTEEGGAAKEIEKIILCGGEANLSGLPEYLSQELHLNVELGNPWVNITDFEDYIPEIEFSDSLMYATAIGLALRYII